MNGFILKIGFRKNKMTAARAGDISVADGQGNVKLHPYLFTLVRWCVSCLWSTATVLLHRLMMAPLQPITGPKPPSAKPRVFKRPAGTEHLHPEPKVECQLLHQPSHHTLDVIFVHGLYGSLGNTWRQGDWRSKYQREPNKVTLRDHSEKTCDCLKSTLPHTQTNSHIQNENIYVNENKCVNESMCVNENICINENKCENDSKSNLNDDIYNIESEMTFKKINEKLFKKIIPKENDLITEQFYNNTLLDQVEIVDNYETQANFVRDLFKRENNCDNGCDARVNENISKSNEINELKCSEKCKISCRVNENKCKDNEVNKCKCSHSENNCKNNNVNEYKCSSCEVGCSCKFNENKCKYNEVNECKCTEKKCEIGCGCVCDDCYSSCWPRDWIKMDFPGARVISINYTSDPYLWRPLWIKENKRLSLHVRAEQMMQQLLEMGVGEKPIIWVGHSKGGLFIKQIYCEAYEEFKKLNKNVETVNPEPKNGFDVIQRTNSTNNEAVLAETIDNIVGNMFDNKEMYTEHDHMTYNDYKEQNSTSLSENKSYKNYEIYDLNEKRSVNGFSNELNESLHFNELTNVNVVLTDNEDICKLTDSNGNMNELSRNSGEAISSTIEEARSSLRASLYSKSQGFMFYSVPHRGSPLADIKTPVTARSLELLEISKDCPLVLDLQARWIEASGARSSERGGARPAVRGFVETCRTLMSVLWLRIVSVNSADAGIGTLLGVSVDHREICKPSSRHCMLYTELTDLIHEALNTCEC